MQRRLRITLAVAAAAGVAVLGAGTAEAQGMFTSPTDKKDCPRFDKDKVEKENAFPSYGEEEAKRNATSKDLRDSKGNLVEDHARFCDPGKPWRGKDWHDGSYDTFKFKYAGPGDRTPSHDPHENSYSDWNGYNKSFQKDPHKYTKLDRDHIGAPRHPDSATS